MIYDYITVLTWETQKQLDYNTLRTYLECCLQLEIDSEDLQICQE